MKSKLVFCAFLFIFFSCKKSINKNLEEENRYEIISVLLDILKEEIKPIVAFPPSPDGKNYKFKKEDSLRIYKYYYEQINKVNKIAIVKFMRVNEESFKFYNCEDFNYKSLGVNDEKNSEEKLIDIEKINLNKKDSLFYYEDKFKEISKRGFNELDLVVSFLRMTFNKKRNKVVIRISVSTGHLNSVSMILYLEKSYYNWKVNCVKGLNIS